MDTDLPIDPNAPLRRLTKAEMSILTALYAKVQREVDESGDES